MKEFMIRNTLPSAHCPFFLLRFFHQPCLPLRSVACTRLPVSSPSTPSSRTCRSIQPFDSWPPSHSLSPRCSLAHSLTWMIFIYLRYWPEKKLKICITGAGGFIARYARSTAWPLFSALSAASTVPSDHNWHTIYHYRRRSIAHWADHARMGR